MSLQHVSISGYLLGAVIEPPSNAQHWSTAESRAGAAAVWRRNPAGEVSILSDAALLEKERNRYYLVLVSRETGFPGEFVGRTRQVIARAKDLRNICSYVLIGSLFSKT